MSQKSDTVPAAVDLSVWIKCPKCKAQINEVTNRPVIDKIYTHMMNKGPLAQFSEAITCPKCEVVFTVSGVNL